jgi:hypothetical protein
VIEPLPPTIPPTLTLATVRGSAQLAFDACAGIAHSVEQMHETIARRALSWMPTPARPGRAHGLIASQVYGVIHGAIRICARGVDLSLRALPEPAAVSASTPRELRTLAALNGVLGDHLEATGNPLAIRMSLIRDGLPIGTTPAGLALAYPDASGHLVVLVHGLCHSESAWHRKGEADIGTRLREALGLTPVYVRYNSGRHISTNGQELAAVLDRLCAAWPVRVESLSLLGHSMGGLVIRSACWYGNEAGLPWIRSLRRVICLGTPHHGSPVERVGHALDRTLRSIRYVEPLMFGHRRSAGIKDLRHGNLLDEDWQAHGPDQSTSDRRRTVPLLAEVDHFFAAASVGRHQLDPKGYLFGDWLVHSGSAVGSHADARKKLTVPPDHCRIFHEKSHLDLLSDAEVHAQVIDWFARRR